jgi:hypothetical protein
MGQLNTSIARSITAPQVRSPLATLKGIQDMEEQRSLNEGRQLVNDRARRLAASQQHVSEVMQRHADKPDDGVDELYQSGDIDGAHFVSDGLMKQRKDRADAQAAKIKTSNDALSSAAHMFEALGDDPDQVAYDTTYRAVAQMIPPELVALIPKQYNKEKTKQMLAWSKDQSESARQLQQSIENANKASTLSLAQAKSWEDRVEGKRKASEYWTKSAATALGIATSQEDWDNKQRLLLAQGAEASDLAPFGRTFSDQAVMHARELGLSPSEQNTAEHQVIAETQAEEGLNLRRRADKRAETASKAPKTLGGLTPNAVYAVENSKKNAYEDFEKDQKTIDPTTGVRPIDDPSDAAKAVRIQRKLSIENTARNMKGQASLEDQEIELASLPGHEAKLRQLRAVYHKIADGQDMPLERQEKLEKKILAEKDPKARAALLKELRDLRNLQTENGR